jgi:hypothetical protein
MKQVIFRYGLLATACIVVVSAILLLAKLPFASGENAGYLTIILSMIFVFMGIRRYRDNVNQGALTFKDGLKVGLLIVLIPSVAFGLFDILYTEVINPGWADNYYHQAQEHIRATASAGKVEEELKALQKNRELFSSPVMQFLLMAVTVFIIGFIATIISSLALMKKRKQEFTNS